MEIVNGKIVIGIDAGNYNTKTSNTCFVSGYKQVGANDLNSGVLEYNEKYYALTNTPVTIRDDKTKNEDFKILSLFAIAKELEAKGLSLGSVSRITLGVGLPPGKMSVADYKSNLIEYYKGTYEFEYNKSPARIEVDDVTVLPQCYSVVMSTLVPDDRSAPQDGVSVLGEENEQDGVLVSGEKNKSILLGDLQNEAQATLLDFGGGTVDVIHLEYGKMSMEHFHSFDLGIRKCLYDIDREIEMRTGYPLGESIITQHLMGRSTRISDEDKNIIDRHLSAYVKELVLSLESRRIPIKNSLVILMGGNAELVYNAIKNETLFGHLKIIPNISANAVGYEGFLKQIIHGKNA